VPTSGRLAQRDVTQCAGLSHRLSFALPRVIPGEYPLARKPNYDFEKRRKEQERAAKKEQKRLRRLEAAQSPDGELPSGSDSPDDSSDDAADGATDANPNG